MKTKNILLVGEINSVHFQKWATALHEIGLFEKIFILDFGRNVIHPNAIKFIEKSKPEITVLYLPEFTKSILKYIFFIFQFKSKLNTLSKIDLQFIHIFNFQSRGYQFLISSKLNKFLLTSKIKNSKIYISSYGSDLVFFPNNSVDKRKILDLLESADLIVVESQREIVILKDDLNFTKQIHYVPSNSVGISNILHKNEFSVNSRNLIMIKGNFGFAGRPHHALDLVLKSLRKIKTNKFKIILFSVPLEIQDSLSVILINFQIEYEIFSPLSLSKENMLSLYKMSRVYVGCSISDGLSTSAIEASSQGAVIFQSDTSSINEHFQRGLLGYEVNLFDLNASIDALVKVLDDDIFYSDIAKGNLDYINNNFSYEVNKSELKKLYGSP